MRARWRRRRVTEGIVGGAWTDSTAGKSAHFAACDRGDVVAREPGEIADASGCLDERRFPAPFLIRMTVFAAMLRGAIGFATASAAAFGVWALAAAGKFPFKGEGAMYLGCTVVFLVLSGLPLHPLVRGPGSLARFYRIFIPAFIAYAVLWCAGWFSLGMGKGEWLGSLAGSAAFAGVVVMCFGHPRAWLLSTVVLFVAHSAGYFLGGELYYPSDHGTLNKLLWGAVYGLGFGAGIGFVFRAAQRERAA